MSFRAADGTQADLAVGLLACMALALTGLAGSTSITLAALGVIGLGAFLRPVGVLTGAIIALPWFFEPVKIGVAHVAASELLLALAAAGTVTGAVLAARRSPRFQSVTWHGLSSVVRSPALVASIMLCLVAIVATLNVSDTAHLGAARRELRWSFIEPAMLVFLVLVHRQRRGLRASMALALLIGASGAALLAGYELLVGGGVAADGVQRVTGPYPHPNALALMMSRSVALAIGWAVLDHRTRPWTVPIALVTGAALLATFSRGAWIAVGIAMLVLTAWVSRRVRVAAAIAAGILLAAALVFASNRLLDVLGGGSGSLRIDIWSSALRMIADRPLRGYGPDQFISNYAPRYIAPEAWDERFTAHAHNGVLDFWVRLGIIGGAFAVVAIWLIMRAAFRLARRELPENTLSGAATVALTAVVVHGLIDNAYFAHDLAMSGWLLAWLAFDRRDTVPAEGDDDVARAGERRGWVHRLASMRQSAR